MSFPSHDRLWTEVADFIIRHRRSGDTILAPDIFWWRLDRISLYGQTRSVASHDWAIIHKGQIEDIDFAYLSAALSHLTPVFANEVFVILADRPELAIPEVDVHVRALSLEFERLAQMAPAVGGRRDGPDRQFIVKFSALSADEFRAEMNRFWRETGYLYPTLRDQTYYCEIDSYVREYAARAAGKVLLDVCCGHGRLLDLISPDVARVVGIDVSDVAIEFARERHQQDARFVFHQMDAASLDFDDASFDTVFWIDSIEHVQLIEESFAQISRVIKPGGHLVVTVANADSVNQVMSRKLGYGGFMTNYQHIQEYSRQQFIQLASRYGFDEIDAGGIMLYPYWGIPGLDEVVRDLTDEDPDVVEMFRDLGRRAGPENSYTFASLLRRRR